MFDRSKQLRRGPRQGRRETERKRARERDEKNLLDLVWIFKRTGSM